MMRTIWIFFVICVHKAIYAEHHHYVYDMIGSKEKNRVKEITEELLKDIILKQRQLANIKREHSVRVSYEVGIVIGKLREKYKRIMDIYREMMDRYRERNLMIGPGMWDLRPFYFVLAMETIKGLEIEIDHSIQILENIPPELINKEHSFGNAMDHGFKKPADPDAHIGPPAFIKEYKWGIERSGPELEANSTLSTEKATTKYSTTKLILDYKGSTVPKFKSQEELKKYYRERYEATEGPRDKALFLDHLYGIV